MDIFIAELTKELSKYYEFLILVMLNNYKYNSKAKEFYMIPLNKDITAIEASKLKIEQIENVINCEDILEIAKKTLDNFIESSCSFENVARIANLISSIRGENYKKTKSDEFSFCYEAVEHISKLLYDRYLNKFNNELEKYKKSFTDSIYNSSDIKFHILSETIKKSITMLKKKSYNSETINKYSNFLNEILRKWRNHYYKKQSNKAFMAINNLFENSSIRDNDIGALSSSLFACFKHFEKIDNNSLIIRILHLTFSELEYDEKEKDIYRLSSILMDKKTYKKWSIKT